MHQRLFTCLLLLFPFLLSAETLTSQQSETIQIELGNRIQFNSVVLGETREILVSLSQSDKQSSTPFSILYLLDGNRHFQHATTAVALLTEQGIIPPTIVVGITNNRGTRGRDLNTQSNKFRQYLFDEVMPYINQHYKTSGINVLFGHSMAGAFTLQQFADEPTALYGYIAASPVLQIKQNLALGTTETLFNDAELLAQSLYFSMTDIAEEGAEATDSLQNYVSLLTSKAPPSLNWEYQFIPSFTHMTTPYLTLYKGLQHTFADFAVPTFSDYESFKQYGGIDGLENFHRLRAEKFKVVASIPERTLRQLGMTLMDSSPNQALNILLVNTSRYPGSPGAKYALGRAHENLGDKEKALTAYKQALKTAKQVNSPAQGFIEQEINRLQQHDKQ